MDPTNTEKPQKKPQRKPPRKARIAPEKRKRILVSCDRCKKRRVRCIPTVEGSCQICLDAKVKCEFNAPRKKRIYGSHETLSKRFRVLEDLVEGLFPDKDTSDIDVLYEIAAIYEVTLPDFAGDIKVPNEELFSQIPKELAESPAHSEGSQQTMRHEPIVAAEKSVALSSVPQERLVPTPAGRTSHYIGPSSSFGFVLTSRSMVKEYVGNLRAVQPDHPSLELMADFAESRWSKALEPKVAEEKHTAPGPADLERDARVPNRSHVISVLTGKDPSGEAPLSLLVPAREVADVLTGSFFDRVHPNYMLFHRRSFEHRYDLMWSQLDIQVQDFEPGWLCSVIMALVLGAQALEPHDDTYLELIRRYVVWVEEHVYQLQCSSTLVNVQALLLLQLYQHNLSERNTAFMMLGAASRMAMNLGMHHEGAINDLDPIEREVRRRVWWTIYIHEHNACTILGRPCAIDDREVSACFPDEDLLDGSACVPKNYVAEFVRLTKIMADTSRKMYPSSSIPAPNAEQLRVRIANQLLTELDSWHGSLPPNLRLEYPTSSPTHVRAVHLLHLQFHLIQSLVVRPFILRKVAVQLSRNVKKHVLSPSLDKLELELSYKGGLYSKQAIMLAHKLITSNLFNGVTWVDSYYIYHSVIVIALDFLAKDEPDTEEDTARRKAVFEIKDAMDNVRLCPLFVILTQVGFQLAEIVGIVDSYAINAHSQQIDTRYLQPNVQEIPDIDFSLENSQQGSMGVIDFFLQGDHVNLPWRVGPDSFNHSPQVSAPMTGAFLDRGVPVMDELAVATTMQAQMQPQQPYMDWPAGYELNPFSQTQYGHSQAGPSHIGNGNGNDNSIHHAHPHYVNMADPAHAHAQYAHSQAGPSHSNGNGRSLNNYEMQRNN
ncbi:hypothetical protein SBOR_1206 [Sclerotinia borealis F-4128]|uniref:Zn(2)-C6 fungal-type domain-containing protein n=1 Tax=Sclerotinia borealis (strain F-4128) TaxID=1432307 RepID=W9CV81_SCLBF|nr:hypothetical protein SBOR_1206 [Sclerotinia borealis F-4128]